MSWDETAAGAVQSVFLGRQDRVLRLGGSVGERSGDREVEGAFWSAQAGLDLRFARRWALFLGAELRAEDAIPAFFDPFTYDRTVAALELAWRFGREVTP